MAHPFFSVILPTKNRSFLVGHAIRSALSQTFRNLEVLLVDNDDTNATARVASEFNDPRLRYVRTGGLSMPDNWEAGCAQARGEYVAVLEDKQAFKRRALQRVHDVVRDERPPVVSWRLDTLRDLGRFGIIDRARGTGEVRRLTSKQVLRQFLGGTRREWTKVLPLGLNSCTHRSLVERIRSGPAGRLCLPVSPDYSMAFLQLAYADHVVNIDEALTVMGGTRYSNGGSFMAKGALARQFLREIGGREEDLYKNVPIKANFIAANSLYNDYLNVRSLVGRDLQDHPLDVPNYFAECMRDIRLSKELGTDVREQETAWQQAFAQQAPEIQARVRGALAGEGLRRWVRRLQLNRIWGVLRQLPQRLSFSNITDYVEWEARSHAIRSNG